MSKTPFIRFEFKLHEALDADIIGFLKSDRRTNVGLFREAVRLLMKAENNELVPVQHQQSVQGVVVSPGITDEEISEAVKNALNEEYLSGIIRKVMNEYDISKTDKEDIAEEKEEKAVKPRMAFGFVAKEVGKDL